MPAATAQQGCTTTRSSDGRASGTLMSPYWDLPGLDPRRGHTRANARQTSPTTAKIRRSAAAAAGASTPAPAVPAPPLAGRVLQAGVPDTVSHPRLSRTGASSPDLQELLAPTSGAGGVGRGCGAAGVGEALRGPGAAASALARKRSATFCTRSCDAAQRGTRRAPRGSIISKL